MKSQHHLAEYLDGMGRSMAELVPSDSPGWLVRLRDPDFRLDSDALSLVTKDLTRNSSSVGLEAMEGFLDWTTLPDDGAVQELSVRRALTNYKEPRIEATFAGPELVERGLRLRPFMRIAMGGDILGANPATVGMGMRVGTRPPIEAVTTDIMTDRQLRPELVASEAELARLIGSCGDLLHRFVF